MHPDTNKEFDSNVFIRRVKETPAFGMPGVLFSAAAAAIARMHASWQLTNAAVITVMHMFRYSGAGCAAVAAEVVLDALH
jgi:hypothetical protein